MTSQGESGVPGFRMEAVSPQLGTCQGDISGRVDGDTACVCVCVCGRVGRACACALVLFLYLYPWRNEDCERVWPSVFMSHCLLFKVS